MATEKPRANQGPDEIQVAHHDDVLHHAAERGQVATDK